MTGIKVTPEELVSLSGQVSAGSAQIDGALGVLTRQLAPLNGGVWAGHASAQFGQLWEQWHRSAASLNESLQGISQLLAHAGQAYGDAEQQIAASFRS